MSVSLLEPSETDVIDILILKSKPFGGTNSTATLGPWIGLQAGQPPQLSSSVKQKRDEKQTTATAQRKRSGIQNVTCIYKFEHFPDWEEYINCYKEAHTAKIQKNPFAMRYAGLPNTFISLPYPENIRLQVRYVEDRSRYPIPVAMEKQNYNFKTSSTPNLCLIPADGTVQLPPLEVQRLPSIRLDSKFIYPKNIAYMDNTRCGRSNYFADSTLMALSNSIDILRVDPPSESKFKARMSNQNEAKNVNLRPFDTRPQTSRKLEKLLVTCENDALNLENMIQSLCKSIPSAKQEQESSTSDRITNKRNKVVSPPTRQVAYTPSAEHLNDSLFNQFSYEGNRVDYDSPLDLQVSVLSRDSIPF